MKVSITRSKLDALANTISTKSGAALPLTLDQMDAAVRSISGGVTVEALNVTANGTYTAPSGTAYSPVTVNVPSSAPSLQSKTATPTEQQQTITADSGYDGLSQVTVNPIPSEYIVPTGELAITANGTVDVSAYASASVNVPTSGATNFVHGEFTTQAGAGVQSVSIPYAGSGYPIMAYVVVKGGAYASGTDWYNAIQRYAVGMWAMSKSVMSSSPTYGTSGVANQGVTCAIYKNSTSSATSYTRTSAMNTNTYSSSNASNAAATCVRFKGSTSMSVYTNTSSYGLLPETDYEYFIVYSE